MVRTFKPILKNELGRHGIEQQPGGLAVVAGFPKPGRGIERSQALVDQTDGQVESALQAFGKFLGESSHGVGRAVGVGDTVWLEMFSVGAAGREQGVRVVAQEYLPASNTCSLVVE